MVIRITTGSVNKTSSWDVVVEAFAARWPRHGTTADEVRVAEGARQVGLAAAHAVLPAVRLALVAADVMLICVDVHVGATAPQVGVRRSMI